MKLDFKLVLVSFILFFAFQLFLKGIGQYNAISFILGGFEFAIYESIAKSITKKQVLTDFEKFKIIEEEKDEK